jgi:hypothetical protein
MARPPARVAPVSGDGCAWMCSAPGMRKRSGRFAFRGRDANGRSTGGKVGATTPAEAG